MNILGRKGVENVFYSNAEVLRVILPLNCKLASLHERKIVVFGTL